MPRLCCSCSSRAVPDHDDPYKAIDKQDAPKDRDYYLRKWYSHTFVEAYVNAMFDGMQNAALSERYTTNLAVPHVFDSESALLVLHTWILTVRLHYEAYPPIVMAFLLERLWKELDSRNEVCWPWFLPGVPF